MSYPSNNAGQSQYPPAPGQPVGQVNQPGYYSLQPWQLQQFQQPLGAPSHYGGGVQQNPAYVPAWQRESNQTAASASAQKPHVCFVVPGLVMSLILLIVAIIGLVSPITELTVGDGGPRVGTLRLNRVEVDFQPVNTSKPRFRLNLMIGDWQGIPGLETMAGRNRGSMAIRVINLLFQGYVSTIQVLRLTGLLDRCVAHNFVFRISVSTIVLLGFVISVIGQIAITFTGRDDIPTFARWLEVQLDLSKDAITASPAAGTAIILIIAILALIILLAFAIRTAVGKRCQECCCDCCGCTLAPEWEPPLIVAATELSVAPGPASVVATGIPAHPVEGIIVPGTVA